MKRANVLPVCSIRSGRKYRVVQKVSAKLKVSMVPRLKVIHARRSQIPSYRINILDRIVCHCFGLSKALCKRHWLVCLFSWSHSIRVTSFLWGYLKDRVYRSYLKSMEKLNSSTERQIFDIPTEVLHSVVWNFGMGLRKIVEQWTLNFVRLVKLCGLSR